MAERSIKDCRLKELVQCGYHQPQKNKNGVPRLSIQFPVLPLKTTIVAFKESNSSYFDFSVIGKSRDLFDS